MGNSQLYPRYAEPHLIEALADSPAVLIYGPRQCGKTTLAQRVGERLGYAYINFDDDVARGAGEADPADFVADLPDRVILDEVQRVPTLFVALKTAIDRKRSPGRYILIGSANVLLVPRLADSLAGRLEMLRLHPLAQCELEQRETGFLDTLFASGFKTRSGERLAGELAERIVAGGYPAALARKAGRRRATWYRDYLDALVQRDVRDLTRISALDSLPRLLALAAALLGINAAALTADRSMLGQMLETFVFQELRRQASWHNESLQFFHFRDKDGAEVDIVIERGAHMLAGVEVKAGATVTTADFRGLRKLKQAAGSRFAGGVVLYDGETCASFGEGMHAVPLRGLWEST